MTLVRYAGIHFIILVLSLVSIAVTADVVVVVSVENPITTLSKEQIADIFLGRKSRFPDGSEAVPIDLADGIELRDQFYTLFVGQSPSQVKAHWARLVFTGRGYPPIQVPFSDNVKKILASNPNAIGYIDSNKMDKNVKALTLN